MTGLAGKANNVLRGDLRSDGDTSPNQGATLRDLAVVLVVCGLFYGAVMGTFGGITGDRPLQVLFSALKVPLLICVTFLLNVPSFFVLNTLLGVRDDFPQALRAVAATQTALTVVLAALSPLVVVWYASTNEYVSAILFNALLFGAASLSAQRLLRRLYAPLITRDSRHRMLLRIWLISYAFVGIQMGWLLRPFVGNPNEPVRFLREDAWGNAYMAVGQMVSGQVSGFRAQGSGLSRGKRGRGNLVIR